MATDKQLLNEWDAYREALKASTAVDAFEKPADRKRRMKDLEAGFEAWVKYYFPAYAYAEPAPFHKEASRRVLNNPEWYECRAWARELAKDTRTMFETLYLILTGKKFNVLLVSSTQDNAERLLEPYRAQLDSNPRIINDYGRQQVAGKKWTNVEFHTKGGVSFRALGAGNNPRGTRNEFKRPDVIIISDLDTDQDCRNPEIIKERWKWVEGALIGTRSTSTPMLIVWLNNIIAEYCCMSLAMMMSDHNDVVNIRDGNGCSTWPAKNTEEMIDRVLSKVSYATCQREYYNNPQGVEGEIFEQVNWGKVPPLKNMDMLVTYADPAPSDRARKSNSAKSVWLVGKKDIFYYVVYGFQDEPPKYKITNDRFVGWFYDIREWATRNGAKLISYFIENNSLQDPYYQQIFKPFFRKKGAEVGSVIPISGDNRDKPDKIARISDNLEPVNRMGLLILNEDFRDNPHFKRLERQFLGLTYSGKCDPSGPDCIEGAKWILDGRTRKCQGKSLFKLRTVFKW
jgi:hypothetical protein